MSKNPLVNKPRFIGAEMPATIIGCLLRDRKEKGRVVIVQFEVLLSPDALKGFPSFVGNAMKPGNDVRQITIATDSADVGFEGSRDESGTDRIRIEKGTIESGVTFRYGWIRGDQPCAKISFVAPYHAMQLKWIADHLCGSELHIRFFDLESEQTKIPGTEAKAAPAPPPPPPKQIVREGRKPKATPKLATPKTDALAAAVTNASTPAPTPTKTKAETMRKAKAKRTTKKEQTNA